MFFMKVSLMLSHPFENSELLRHAEVMLKTSWESKGTLENIWGKDLKQYKEQYKSNTKQNNTKPILKNSQTFKKKPYF